MSYGQDERSGFKSDFMLDVEYNTIIFTDFFMWKDLDWFLFVPNKKKQ